MRKTQVRPPRPWGPLTPPRPGRLVPSRPVPSGPKDSVEGSGEWRTGRPSPALPAPPPPPLRPPRAPRGFAPRALPCEGDAGAAGELESRAGGRAARGSALPASHAGPAPRAVTSPLRPYPGRGRAGAPCGSRGTQVLGAALRGSAGGRRNPPDPTPRGCPSSSFAPRARRAEALVAPEHLCAWPCAFPAGLRPPSVLQVVFPESLSGGHC